MNFTGVIKRLIDLTEQTTAAVDDYLPIGKAALKRISFANLKKAFGIDDMSTSISNLSDSVTTINDDLSTLETSYTGTLYQNEIVGTVLDLAGGDVLRIGVSASALNNRRMLINTTAANRASYTNMPSVWNGVNVIVAVKNTYYLRGTSASNAHVLVELTECWPVPGRILTNFLNYGSWTGWKVQTPS